MSFTLKYLKKIYIYIWFSINYSFKSWPFSPEYKSAIPPTSLNAFFGSFTLQICMHHYNCSLKSCYRHNEIKSTIYSVDFFHACSLISDSLVLALMSLSYLNEVVMAYLILSLLRIQDSSLEFITVKNQGSLELSSLMYMCMFTWVDDLHFCTLVY